MQLAPEFGSQATAETTPATATRHPCRALGVIAASKRQVNGLEAIRRADLRATGLAGSASSRRQPAPSWVSAALISAFALIADQANANSSDREYAQQTLRFLLQVDGTQRRRTLTADEYQNLVRQPIRQILGRWERRGAREYSSCVSAARVQRGIGMGRQRGASSIWLTDQQNKFYSYISTCRRVAYR